MRWWQQRAGLVLAIEKKEDLQVRGLSQSKNRLLLFGPAPTKPPPDRPARPAHARLYRAVAGVLISA